MVTCWRTVTQPERNILQFMQAMDSPAAFSEILPNGPPLSTLALDHPGMIQWLVQSISRFDWLTNMWLGTVVVTIVVVVIMN